MNLRVIIVAVFLCGCTFSQKENSKHGSWGNSNLHVLYETHLKGGQETIRFVVICRRPIKDFTVLANKIVIGKYKSHGRLVVPYSVGKQIWITKKGVPVDLKTPMNLRMLRKLSIVDWPRLEKETAMIRSPMTFIEFLHRSAGPQPKKDG